MTATTRTSQFRCRSPIRFRSTRQEESSRTKTRPYHFLVRAVRASSEQAFFCTSREKPMFPEGQCQLQRSHQGRFQYFHDLFCYDLLFYVLSYCRALGDLSKFGSSTARTPQRTAPIFTLFSSVLSKTPPASVNSAMLQNYYDFKDTREQTQQSKVGIGETVTKNSLFQSCSCFVYVFLLSRTSVLASERADISVRILSAINERRVLARKTNRVELDRWSSTTSNTSYP